MEDCEGLEVTVASNDFLDGDVNGADGLVGEDAPFSWSSSSSLRYCENVNVAFVLVAL